MCSSLVLVDAGGWAKDPFTVLNLLDRRLMP